MKDDLYIVSDLRLFRVSLLGDVVAARLARQHGTFRCSGPPGQTAWNLFVTSSGLEQFLVDDVKHTKLGVPSQIVLLTS